MLSSPVSVGASSCRGSLGKHVLGSVLRAIFCLVGWDLGNGIWGNLSWKVRISASRLWQGSLLNGHAQGSSLPCVSTCPAFTHCCCSTPCKCFSVPQC